MPGKSARLELSREQILGFRREAGSLNERLLAIGEVGSLGGMGWVAGFNATSCAAFDARKG
jgi:hypothetical protein